MGVAIGPDSDVAPWGGTPDKLINRPAAIVAGRHSPAAGAQLYARCAVLMVHYVAQVRMPPPAVARLDLRIPARILHLPSSPIPMYFLMRLRELGAMKIPSVIAFMVASFVRFALSPSTDFVGALACFSEDTDELPLSWTPYAFPRRWRGACMAVIRSTTKAACIGTRMQTPDAMCVLCALARDSFVHHLSCQAALSTFCAAMGRPAPPSVLCILATDLPRAAVIFSRVCGLCHCVHSGRLQPARSCARTPVRPTREAHRRPPAVRAPAATERQPPRNRFAV